MQIFARRRLSRLSRRVKRGAALFDFDIAGWAFEVDLGRLDMRSLDACVLAQLHGTLVAGLDWLYRDGSPSASGHGLIPTVLSHLLGTAERDYRELTLFWAAEILVRRRDAPRRLVALPKAQPVPVLV